MATPGAVKLEERKRQFMTGVDIDDQRIRREQFAVDLRKQKRMDNASKRRLLSTSKYSTAAADGPENLSLDGITETLIVRFPALADGSLSDLARAKIVVDILQTPQPTEVVQQAVAVIRKTLSKDLNPPVRALMSVGAMPALMPYLAFGQYPKTLVYEATWAVCNLLSGPHEAVEEFMSLHGLQSLMPLLNCSDLDITEHAVWALGNLAADCAQYRDIVLLAGGHKAINLLLREPQNMTTAITRIAAWTLAIMLKPKQLPALPLCRELLPMFYLLSQTPDADTKKEVLWGLSHLTEADTPLCRLAVDNGFVPFAMSGAADLSSDLQVPAIRTLGNIASTDDAELTQSVLDFGLLDTLLPLVDSPEFLIRKEVMWTLSNVTAGTLSQLAAFLSHPIARVALKGLEDPVYAVRKEAAFIYSNVAKQGNNQQRLQLVTDGIFLRLASRMLQEEADLVSHALGIIASLLKAGQDSSSGANSAAVQLERTGALSLIERLQHNFSNEIAELALFICDTFYGLEDKVAQMGDDVNVVGQFEV